MISTLMVTKKKSIFAGIIETFVNEDFKIFWSDSGTDALFLVKENFIDLLIIDEKLPDMTARQFIEKIIMKNPMINCVVASPISEEAFHEKYEGLGLLMQFPVMPGKKEAQKLFEHMEHIFIYK